MASWVRGRCIGRGSFGTVSLGFHNRTGEVFAVKSVHTASCLPHQIESLENEIRILRSLPPSPYVVAYLRDDVTSTCRNLHMEYVPGGTAADFAARRGGKFSDVDEAVVRSQARCVVSALQQLHSRGIVHCDVKGSNILVGRDPRSAKLADFGSAIRIGESGDRIAPRGSPLWMAPEVIRGECQGPPSDVWSLGCAVVEMVTGRPPWEDRGVVDTLRRMGYSTEMPEYPAELSKQGRDFLENCLRRDPEARWSCDRLLQHPFLQNDAVAESSPRGVLDWVSSEFEDDEEEDGADEEAGANGNSISEEDVADARARIVKLSSRRGATWESEGWTVVRTNRECEREAEEEAGTSSRYRETPGLEWGNGSGIVEYSNFSGRLLATEAQCNSLSPTRDGSEEEGGGGYVAAGEKEMGFCSSRGVVALLLHYYYCCRCCHCLLRILSRNILLLFCYFTFARFSSSCSWCVHDLSA